MGGKPEDVWKEFYIPDYIAIPGTKPTKESHVPSCPVIVFINSKSGGQLGRELLITYRSILNRNQVFDLGERAPDKVLSELYGNLVILKSNGDTLASEIHRRLRIIVAGGDGTASWLLGVVSDLKLPKPPPVATVPLGTGNNLPFSFGWGKRNPGTDKQSVQAFLDQVKTARGMKIDSWHVIMKMRAPKKGPCDPIAPLELPHSMHAFHRDSSTSTSSGEDYHIFRGGFWNYFSLGMDAQVSYAFHSERKLHPEKFKSQLINQSTYLKLGCTQGWFLTPLFHPTSRNIAQLAKVKIKRRNGQWVDLHMPRSIRSIVCLNLPSFSGGLNPWGKPNLQKSHERNLTPPYVDDGLIEIVGFRNAWHGLVLFTPNGHGTRLAQTNGVRFEFHKGAADHTYMRMDGEPWKQPLPVDDDAVVVEITHSSQVTMLAAPTCRSKSVYDPNSPMAYADEEDYDSSEEADLEEGWEERRKFGAADTFKLPDGVEIARLS